MKALLINGSPHPQGCTYTALTHVATGLKEGGVDSEILQIGKEPVRGCLDCGACKKTGRCIYTGDIYDRAIELMRESDALVVGSPVYYSSPNGSLIALLDRMFFSSPESLFAHKPAAAIVSARRGGTTASFDVLNKYFTISQMPVVTSCYWNMVHGNKPEEVQQDLEGLYVMRTLGRNMAWLMSCIANSGITPPAMESPRAQTNFIR